MLSSGQGQEGAEPAERLYLLQHDVKAASSQSALYFAELLIRLTSYVFRNLFLLCKVTDTQAVQRAKTVVQEQMGLDHHVADLITTQVLSPEAL